MGGALGLPAGLRNLWRVLDSQIATGALVTATAAAPTSPSANYITGLLIVASNTGVAATAGEFDVVTTGLPGAQITIPVPVSASLGVVFLQLLIPFANPLKAAAATAVTLAGTATAQVRLSLTILGFVGP